MNFFIPIDVLNIGVFNFLNMPQLTGNIQVEQKKNKEKIKEA